MLHALRKVTHGNNRAFAGHHQDTLSVDISAFPGEAGLVGQGMVKVTRHLRDLLAAAVGLAALAGMIAVGSVEATAQPKISAVPISWLSCDENAIGRDSGTREFEDDACALLSRWSSPWLDEDDDE